MSSTAPPFAIQRIVCFALLLGMVAFAVVVALVLQSNEGRGLAETRIEVLDTMAIAVGVASATGALVLRTILNGKAAAAPPAERASARFVATLVPLATLEGGCMLALTAWLLNGTMFPNLAVAGLLLTVAIVVVPFRNPDDGSS
jgi:hypothetical protein